MSILPVLQSKLVGAAQRRRDQARHRRRTITLLAVASLTVTGTAAAGVVLTGVIGGPPTRPILRVQAEERDGMTRTTDPVVLGRLRFAGTAKPVELIGYRMNGYRGRGSLLCLDLANPDGTKSGGCSPDLPPERNGLAGTLLGPNPTSPSIAVGATRARTSRVTIRYRLAGTHYETAAQSVRVPGPLASRLRTEAFTYYAAAIPRGAIQIRAIRQR